ncbi:MAG: hypothetical protein ACOH1T_02775 [Microbacteriaceae bacterium]
MRIRTVAAGAMLLALLAGCAPDTPPATDPAPETKPPVTKPAPPQPPLPADALMLVTATATASTGGVLELRAVIHQAQASSQSTFTPAVTQWCDGELDAGVLTAQNYSILQVEYTATAPDGAKVWPTAEQVWLHPTPDYNGLAHDGFVHQVEYPLDTTEPGAYVPHCVHYAMLDGAGTGSSYAAIESDVMGREGAAPLQFWSRLTYGFGNTYETDTNPVIFSNCTTTITDLGASLGAPSPGWHEDFLPAACVVGGTTGN